MGFSATTISVHLQNVKIFRNMLLPSYKYNTVQSYHTRLNPNHLTCGLNNLLRVKSYNRLCPTQSIHTTPVCLKTQKRNQKKKGSQKYTDDDEDNMVGIEDEEEGLDTNSAKVMHIRVSSLRTDTVLRSTFQIARNKIEKMFYESKIRVNGFKIIKKSHNVSLGDEIDLIKGFSPVNPKFLLVQRVKVLAASDPSTNDDEDNITLKIRRYKSLTIDNYEEDEYKESAPSNS